MNNTVITVILFVAGLVLVVKGGDWFVDAATWLAEVTGIPKFIVGATVVSFATTLPEVLVSAFAAWEGHPGMALGNAFGSVVCNTGLILALSTAFMAGPVERKQFRNKGILLLLAIAAILFFGRDFTLSVGEAVVLIIICALFMTDSILSGREEESHAVKKETTKKETAKNAVLFIAGAGAMAVGARLMVDNGETLARLLNVPDIIISITLIAIGTSLPELVTAITAISKKQSDISIGNIVGANVLDMCFVVPVSSFIASMRTGATLQVDPSYLSLHIPAALIISSVAVIPTIAMKKTSRWQGVLLLGLYAAYLVISVTSGLI